jgi:hypothetical protein
MKAIKEYTGRRSCTQNRETVPTDLINKYASKNLNKIQEILN